MSRSGPFVTVWSMVENLTVSIQRPVCRRPPGEQLCRPLAWKKVIRSLASSINLGLMWLPVLGCMVAIEVFGEDDPCRPSVVP